MLGCGQKSPVVSMSSTNELIGSQLGRYRIVDHLATGGMAEIFLARHDAMGRFRKKLVLKVLQTRWEDKPEIVDLFLGEARLSALMDYPNIVDVYDVAEENGRHFIVMEYIAGKTLTELAKRAIAVTKSIPVEVGVQKSPALSRTCTTARERARNPFAWSTGTSLRPTSSLVIRGK